MFTIGSTSDGPMAKLFFSYAHEDEDLRDSLETHLATLKREGLVEAVHDRRIVAGEPVDQAIDAYLEEADIVLCLVSPDFLDSDYCYSREMTRALERHQQGETQVIPVILRHCDWQHTPLRELLGTPRDNKPVRAWADLDEALNDVASSVRRAVESRPGNAAPASREAMPPAESTPMNVATRPRSANLQVPKKVSDKGRDDYVEDAFEFLAEFFANSVDELQSRNPDIEAKVVRLDARRFVAAAYKDGKKVSAITVYQGGSFGHGRGISFNNSDAGETNSSNGSFNLSDRGDELSFQSLFGFGGDRERLNHEAVAEAIWASFMSPLQR
jgi:hypothetical protein